MLVLFGIVLIAGFIPGDFLGFAVALMSALLASVFPVLNRRIVNQGRLDPLLMMTWEMVGACLVCLAAMPWIDGPGAYSRMMNLQGLDWLWLIVLAWVCTLFSHVGFIQILRSMSAYTANLAINFEPVYGVVAAALLFGEHRQLHPGFFFGAGTILIANILHPVALRWLARRKGLRTEDP